ASLVTRGSRTLRVRSQRAAADWTPHQHLDTALATMGEPWIAHDTRAVLLDVAHKFHDGRPTTAKAQALQRLLCQLVVSGPDAQFCGCRPATTATRSPAASSSAAGSARA